MNEAVTDVIVSRSRPDESLKAMIVWSLGLHAAVIIGMFFVPDAAQDAPRTVMTVSLSGSEGPRSEGMTQAGAQPVREVAKPEEKPVVVPPREKVEMTLPDPKAKTRVQTKTQTAEKPETTTTTAPSPTRIRGQGFGLSTSGGGGLGGVQVEATDFCCPEYLDQMVQTIRTRWNNKLGVTGTTGMKFTILRDGTISLIQIETPSGRAVLDIESQHALAATARLAPLPRPYPNTTLTVHLLFDYYN